MLTDNLIKIYQIYDMISQYNDKKTEIIHSLHFPYIMFLSQITSLSNSGVENETDKGKRNPTLHKQMYTDLKVNLISRKYKTSSSKYRLGVHASSFCSRPKPTAHSNNVVARKETQEGRGRGVGELRGRQE